jgi:hypothetical protein
METQAADLLLGVNNPGDRFTIKWCGIKFRLQIKMISTERLIKISREICKIDNTYDEDDSFFTALMNHAPDAHYVCRAIAISTGTPFVRLVTRAIRKLPIKDVQTLFKIVQNRSDAEVFFYTMASARKMNILKKVREE